MEEEQFQRLLELFPVVRSSSYCADEVNRRIPPRLPSSTVQLHQVDTGSPSEEIDTTDKGDIQSPPTPAVKLGDGANFWDLLKSAAEQQLSPENARQFCDTFKARHNDLVNNTLSLDAIDRVANHWPVPTK